MSETIDKPGCVSEPAWELARLFPDQGHWSEQDYLDLDTKQLVEFSDGYLEFLPMPTLSAINSSSSFLYRALEQFVSAHKLGKVLVAAYKVRLWPGKFREPDVLFVSSDHVSRMSEQFTDAADLVIEVVSEGGRPRDLEIKREEYARAGIPEYWIVDPQSETITVLALEGSSYVVHGEYARGMEAVSRLLPGFAVAVTEVFSVKP